MATVQKIFTGKMNSDVSEYMLPDGDYLYAMNLRIGSSDGQDVGTVTNVKSNKVIPLPASLQYLVTPVSGLRIKVIGTCVAEDVKKVFWFVYRSDNKDFILEYDSPSQTISKILVNLDDTGDVDITHFSLRYPINSANLVDGTYLKFTDNHRSPGSIDIIKFKSGYYGTILDEYIRAAKKPPYKSPIAEYVSDTNVNYNRLKKNIFQFQTLFVHDGNERSVYSPASIRPIPEDEALTDTDTDPTQNNGIDVTFDIGGRTIKSIELIARSGISDWFLVNVFDKADITSVDQFGNPNDMSYDPSANTYKFRFYNDGEYNNVDQSEEILLFDYMPDLAKTQAYANGSMIYAGITEGRNAVPVSGNVFPTYTSSANPTGRSIKAWKTNSRYQFGLVYYENYLKSGTTNNVKTFNVSTKPFAQASGPHRVGISWSILNDPPQWATSYQWVRTEQLTHQFFLFWTPDVVTQVVQSSITYYDLFIDTLESFNRANKGSILSYDYAKGDRVTVHRPDQTSMPITGYDVEIVEFQVFTPPTIPETIPGPIYRLRIVAKTGVTLAAGALLEIYRPKPSAPSGEALNVFHEFGQVFDITNPGTPSAAHSVTSGNFDNEGDVFYRSRDIPTTEPLDDPTTVYPTIADWVEDPNFSDFYVSNFSSNGRSNIIDKNNQRTFLPATYRFSETYIPNTQINGLSRLYPLSTIEYDKSYGPTQRIELRDNYIIAFQQLKVGAIPLFATIIEKQNGENDLVLSEELLNKIRYYFGDYGIGDFPSALARNDGVFYFTDASRGVVLKLDGSGLNTISRQASMDNFFESILKQYARGNQGINGGFENRFSEYVLSFQNEDVELFNTNDPEDSVWSNPEPTNLVDRSTVSITTGPAHGTVSIISPGFLRFHGETGFTGLQTVVYQASDIFGNVLPPAQLCINVISAEGTEWVGLNPKCFTIMTVTKKYFLNRQLYNSDGSGPFLCNGLPITQENYNPADPSGSMADPDYVTEVTDDCFCLGDCSSGPTGDNNFINGSPYAFIVNEGTAESVAIAAHEDYFYEFDGKLYYTIRAVNSDPALVHIYHYFCATVDPMTVTPILNIMEGTTYYISVDGGDTIYITAGTEPVPTC